MEGFEADSAEVLDHPEDGADPVEEEDLDEEDEDAAVGTEGDSADVLGGLEVITDEEEVED